MTKTFGGWALLRPTGGLHSIPRPLARLAGGVRAEEVRVGTLVNVISPLINTNFWKRHLPIE